MDDHDSRHDQGQNVHEVGRSLEDYGIRQFNRPRVAHCLDARCTREGRLWPNGRA
jgi:hypothetical protein